MKRALLATVAVAASGALLAPLIATADHRAGHKPGEANPNLSIDVEPAIQRWPKTVTISGRLRGQDNANKTIELRANPYPFPGPFKKAGTTTTDANGDYSFTHRPDEHTRYRVVADLNPDEFSGEVEVKSKMKLTRRVSDRTPSDGERITFSGRLGPAHPGHTVRIQRRRPSGSWKTMTSTPAGEAGPTNHSPYSTEVRINRSGVWRAKVRADEHHRGNKSRRIRITVE